MRVRVGNMAGFGLCTLVILLLSIEIAHFTDPAAVCVIELECAECVPDNAPLVTSHVAATGAVWLAAGEEVALSCAAGRFLAYPLRATLRARCEAGRYRVAHDRALRHLLDLGCQENVFEDVLHEVEDCSPPLQGRVYLVREGEGAGQGGARHLAAACFDADRGEAVRVRMSAAPHNRLSLAPHTDRSAPLSVLGNFNHMFDATTRRDAARLYSDDARLNRRLREAFKHDRFAFADQTLTSATLLSPRYFEDRNARVTDFASNRVAVWSGVAKGNLDHLQRDVAEFLKKHRAHVALDVHAGTHGVLALRTGAGATRSEVYLRAGGRFPVPRYLWTAVVARERRAALVVFVLNDPFVAVSEIREAVFCESACGRVPWLRELVRQRRYETAVYGLVFCCRVEDALPHVPGLPRALRDLAPGDEGLLTDLSSDETSARE